MSSAEFRLLLKPYSVEALANALVSSRGNRTELGVDSRRLVSALDVGRPRGGRSAAGRGAGRPFRPKMEL